ncbi:MAG: bifunctional pyr operon transcriptional regulator/uracil phosphoribosyltransferase PyrR [Rhodocyclaceae bacterium]
MREGRFRLYSSAQLDAVLDRMAHQAAGLLAHAADPLLLGILRRGVPLAEMMQARLAARGMRVPRLVLELKRYADDLALLHPETALAENAELSGRDLSRAAVMVIDDVLYEGHSAARILAYLSQRGVQEVRVAVLVDRCVPRLPVRADIAGIRLQVAPGDVVECRVPPYEPEFAIDLVRH